MSIVICKNCGSKNGFYTKERFSGSCEIRYEADGTYSEDGANGDLYEHAIHTGGKTAYCIDCNKSLGRSEKLIKDY